jgi:hypothetical protein
MHLLQAVEGQRGEEFAESREAQREAQAPGGQAVARSHYAPMTIVMGTVLTPTMSVVHGWCNGCEAEQVSASPTREGALRLGRVRRGVRFLLLPGPR